MIAKVGDIVRGKRDMQYPWLAGHYGIVQEVEVDLLGVEWDYEGGHHLNRQTLPEERDSGWYVTPADVEVLA